MGWGFVQLAHNLIWWLLFFGIVSQFLIVLIMAGRLCNAQKRGLNKLGYDIGVRGKIYSRLTQNQKDI